MDYEKKYKEALSTARKLYNMRGDWTNLEIESIFPELRENEDERIRKKIIATIHLYYGEPLEDEAKEMIAWLEKQGKNNMGISEATKQELEDNLNKALEKETPESCNKFLEMQVEQKPTEWNEEDEKKLLCICAWIKDYPRIADFKDEMYTVANNCIDWLKSLRPQSQWKPSDKQLEALKEACDKHWEPDGLDPLYTLYQELKKLRKE